MTAQTVVVTDGNQRAALAVVRSLGRAGFRCVVASPVRRSIAGVSRHAAREVVMPDALERPSEFVAQLVALAQMEHAAVVIPITEQSLLAVLPERARFSPAVVPFVDAATFASISDKQRLLQEAESLGIAVPRQWVVNTPADVMAADFAALHYPVVLKPARSVGEHDGKRSKLGVSYSRDERELRGKLAACHPSAFPVLVQHRIVGPGTGVFLCMWNGELHASFAHERLWEKPPSGGVSVYCESVELDHNLLNASRVLLERFGWRGVAMVEYKRDLVSGTPYLMEINGRFWGSLQLAIDAGVDFPRLLACAALDVPAPPVTSYRLGVRCRWWWGQVDHVLARVRRKELRALLPPGTASMLSTLIRLVTGPLRPHEREEVFRWSDPRPFMHETLRWLRGQ